ncbi:MAG TPA: 6-phosphogluconolactonase [Pyrinomonadaceae bacterium]|nr:6-phosphogluconolactonase [Pyrinomonadaceae bacterium]
MKVILKNGARIEVMRDLGEASARAAESFRAIALRTIAERGRFRAAIPGGSTPKALFGLLASDEYCEALARIWPHAHVFWTDERCVPPDDPQSNFGMAHRALLSHVPVPASQVHRMRGEDEPERAAASYASVIESEFGAHDPVFDLVLLGMGEDAHTASIFPRSPLLKDADGHGLVAAPYVEKLRAHRLTLTLRVLNSAANVIFLVSGKDKAAPLSKVFASPDADEELPARYVRPVYGELIWLVDEEAARLLS